MEDCSWLDGLLLIGMGQGSDHKLCSHMVGQFPAHDLACPKINYDREITPPPGGRDMSDISR